VLHYQLLNKAERKQLRNDTWTFISRKDWEGCHGLSVTDEMKVTIAAQACLMLLAQDHDYYGRVRSILLYPTGFRVQDERWQDEGWTPMGVAGVAIHRGPVILAWDRVLEEGRDVSTGSNLVIHEFAHQLDFMDGYADATFDLPGEQAEQWQDVLTAEYSWLRREVRRGRDTFLGDYAATNKSEFFATASERFFMQPAKLRHYHAELYQMLKIIYAINPAKWFAGHR
jgi:MtfA peptidase